MHGLFRVITLGCKVNQYESAYFKDSLVRAGWREAERGERAHISVVNTCIVTQRAAHQSRQAIRKAVRENPAGLVVAVGCYAQVFPDELSDIEGLLIIAGNSLKKKLPDLLLDAVDSRKKGVYLRSFDKGESFEFLEINNFPGRTRAYLKIQDGCESFCSYCIVPFARGPYRSLHPSKVLDMIASLSGRGYKEIVLTGIHIGKYGVDIGKGFGLTELLRSIGRENFPVRIRLSSLEPGEINRDLIKMSADEEWLCRHFHISLQSVDDRLLKRMNRKCTSRENSELIERIYSEVPFVSIGIDLICGFPGEDDASYEDACALIGDLPISYLHVFPFSPRAGTHAAGFEGRVDPVVIKKRAQVLRNLAQKKRLEFYERCMGSVFPVLVEGRDSDGGKAIRGTSDNYLPVIFDSPLLSEGLIVDTRINGQQKGRVTGSVISISKSLSFTVPSDLHVFLS